MLTETSPILSEGTTLGWHCGQPVVWPRAGRTARTPACPRIGAARTGRARLPGLPKSARRSWAERRPITAADPWWPWAATVPWRRLINEQPLVPIAVLPSGTENLFAGHFGFNRDIKALAAAIDRGESLPIDVGQGLGRRFVLMAGFGFDGDVVTRHHNSRTSRVGVARPTHRVAYVEPVLRSSLFYRFPAITVRIADSGAEESLVGTTVFVFNMPRYALGLPFAPDAHEDDGWLDLVVFRDPGPFQALYYLWRVFCRSHLQHPSVYHRRVKKVVVTAQVPVPVQLDGDPGGIVLPARHGQREMDKQPAMTSGLDLAKALPASLANQTATVWTVEILPAALSVMAVADRHGRAGATSARQKPARAIG